MKKKNVLLVSYYFPPASTPRSLRWENLTRLLEKKIGWIIITGSGSKDFGKRCINIGDTSLAIKKLFRYPDTELIWSIKTLLFLLKNKTVVRDCSEVITVSYPWSSLLVGYFCSKFLKKRWILDLGDPWSLNPFMKFKFIQRPLSHFIEKFVLHYCSLVIVTTNETANLYRENYRTKDVRVIPQGFDADAYEKKTSISKFINKDKINIVYTGKIYDYGRDGQMFLFALKNYARIKKFNFIFAGDITDNFKRSVQKYDLDSSFFFPGILSKPEIIKLQKSADLLLLLGNDSSVQLPGKIFEYIGANKPIWCVYYNECDLGKKMILKEGLGLCSHNSTDEIHKALDRMTDFKKNYFVKKQTSAIHKYSWKNRSEKLYTLIK